jgi:uncharacterized protein
VRHHELAQGHLARIEVGSAEWPRLLADEFRQELTDHLRSLGYAWVTVDLLGYRRGSTNGISSQIQFQPKRSTLPA